MKNVQALIPRITERQGEALREKLSNYVAFLIEKNATRLSKYEKPAPEDDVRPE
jgi:hypothetical protein